MVSALANGDTEQVTDAINNLTDQRDAIRNVINSNYTPFGLNSHSSIDFEAKSVRQLLDVYDGEGNQTPAAQ